ncbi:hypothetical protein C0J52_10863 [Blattella germanica]|nr:hypothetical protein C0J52_10863 [Blattella germanica]
MDYENHHRAHGRTFSSHPSTQTWSIKSWKIIKVEPLCFKAVVLPSSAEPKKESSLQWPVCCTHSCM